MRKNQIILTTIILIGIMSIVTGVSIKQENTSCTYNSLELGDKGFLAPTVPADQMEFPLSITKKSDSFWLIQIEEFAPILYEYDSNGILTGNFYLGRMGDLTTDGINLFIYNSHDKLIYKFDENINAIGNFSINLPNPHGITYDGTNFWITDINDKTINKYDTNLNHLKSISIKEAYTPTGITTDKNKIYITDSFKDELQVYDKLGNFIEKYNIEILGIHSPLSIVSNAELTQDTATEFWIINKIDAQIYHLELTEKTYTSGDTNNDSKIDLSDVYHLINYVFKGGEAPKILKSGDVNSDGKINSRDIIYLINFLFRDGPEPTCANS